MNIPFLEMLGLEKIVVQIVAKIQVSPYINGFSPYINGESLITWIIKDTLLPPTCFKKKKISLL